MQTGKASTSSVVRPSNILVREPHIKDIAELSVTMRDEDQKEIWHLGRKSPHEALWDAMVFCKYNRVVLLDGQVVCMFGVGGEEGGVGVPWMLASPLLTKISKPFLLECRGFLEEMSQEYTRLYNVAWTKNDTHIKWLKWLGFTIQDAKPMGPDGELFHEFYKDI